jgi:hypothetical protein
MTSSGPPGGIRLNFVGDLCLTSIDTSTFHIDDSLLQLFATADVNVANLECVLTHSGAKAPHHPIHLKSEPEASPLLDMMHVFSLANNHIMDYGPAGLNDTIAFLDSRGKRHFGAGATEEDASAPLSVEIRGKKIAFIGSARWYPAAGRKPGTAPDRSRKLERLVGEAKRTGHFVVVFAHWNYEYIHYPAPDNRALAKRLVAAGADLIVGSHPHIIQGYEQYRGKYIFHSLGNFVFSHRWFRDVDLGMYPEAPALNETFILSVDIGEDNRYDYRITPVVTSDHDMRALTPPERERFFGKLERISRVLLDDAVHHRTFYQQSRYVSRKSSGTLRKHASRQGIMSMLVVLAGLRRQDLKILMHSLVHRS